MPRHLVPLLAVACTILAVSVRHLWDRDQQYLLSNGDTTAVILNWSRLANVVRIVSELCQPQLQGTISQIFIWNNSPHKLNYTVRPFAAPLSVIDWNVAADLLGFQMSRVQAQALQLSKQSVLSGPFLCL